MIIIDCIYSCKIVHDMYTSDVIQVIMEKITKNNISTSIWSKNQQPKQFSYFTIAKGKEKMNEELKEQF